MADTPVAQAVEKVQANNNPEGGAPIEQSKPEAADPRLDALARKEKQLHKIRKEIEAEKAMLKQKATEYETGYIPKHRLTEDPFGVLHEAGLGYEKLTELLIQQPNMNDPAMRAIMSKFKALEDKQASLIKQQEDSESKQVEEAKKQITSEIKQLVASNADYEMIKTTGMEEAVLELIDQTHTSEGYLMNIDDACKQVEEHLLAEAEKIAAMSKVQNRLKKPEVQAEGKPAQSTADQKLKTLTNAVSATPTKRLSDKERVARAKEAFYGRLKG